jgi:hypothetical protein
MGYICLSGKTVTQFPGKIDAREITMANNCSKCGAELGPESQTCAACGAQAAAAAAAPVKQGSNVVKIILIVVLICVGLGILGAGAFSFMVWRIAHAIHVSSTNAGGDVTMHMGGGSISANTSETFTSGDLGTDIYPGAQAGKGSMRMSTPGGSMVSAVYITGDSKAQVLAFYKSKFGSDASVFDAPTGTVLTVSKNQQESVVLTITPASGEYQGKTQITIVHTTSNKPS